MRAAAVAAILLALAAGGCTTTRESNPQRTATEQLLVSKAADHAAEQLELGLPKGTKVFLDPQYFAASDIKPDQQYAIAAIRAQLLKQGMDLVADKGAAQAVVEIRAGALSIDQDSNLIGIPSLGIPIPTTGSAFNSPEIALYKKDLRKGIAKFALVGYDAKTGEFETASGPVLGYSYRRHYVVFFFFSWTRNDILPEDDEIERNAELQDKRERAPQPPPGRQ